VRAVKPFRTLTTDPTTSSAAAVILPPEPGHCADAFLSAAFRYHGGPGSRSLTRRVVLPSSRLMALLGFFPSQVCSRIRVDAPSKLGGYG
jgi:hypothetical protein